MIIDANSLQAWPFTVAAEQSPPVDNDFESSAAGIKWHTSSALESACHGHWAEDAAPWSGVTPACFQDGPLLTSVPSSDWQDTWISESILSSDLAKKFDESGSEMQEGFNEQNKSDGPSCSDTEQHSNAENIIVLDTPLPTISPLDLYLERPHLATNFASTNEDLHLLQPRGRDTCNNSTSTQEKQIICVWPSCLKSFSSRSSYKSDFLIIPLFALSEALIYG
jgi:hypothetical protein